ncbi:MAG: tRNA (adenosine(37)-N6)-threonylcarbamoyltransferase complex transferase subunit TsaD [bacterium]
MLILGLESSCDESAVAVWDSDRRKVCYEQVLTQIDLHSAYGGVVPGIAIREHLSGFPILLKNLAQQFALASIDKIVVTHGPGLIGSLGIGIAYAQSLQVLLKKPLAGVNHLQGHALSPFLQAYSEDNTFSIDNMCPHLGLLVSGGNTLLFELMHNNNALRFKILAQTIDDAAGEALDKGAKMLGFPYPGGPFIEKCALNGDAHWASFPKAFPKKTDFKFSFSGLKTSLRYFLDKLSSGEIEQQKPSICASYQQAVVDALTKKVEQALSIKPYKSLGLSGGVSNNNTLRNTMEHIADSHKIPFFVPPKRYCGDNATMIAFAGAFFTAPLKIDPNRTLEAVA